jgi:hypothetical protein
MREQDGDLDCTNIDGYVSFKDNENILKQEITEEKGHKSNHHSSM